MLLSQNVTIPLSLVNQIIDLLGYWNIRDYDPSIHADYCNILSELHVKKLKVELRDAYSKIIGAPNQDARDLARIHYLQQKRLLDNLFDTPF